MDDDKDYGPNPELYAKLSQPHKTQEEADFALKGFLLAVKKLREEYGIPELLVIGACYFEPRADSKNTVSSRAVAFGAHEMRAQLGALAFNAYTLPELERAEQLRDIATGPSTVRKKVRK